MFKNKKSWIVIILLGMIIGLIAGIAMRPKLEYVNRSVPIVYYLKGKIETGKTINYILEVRQLLEKEGKRLGSVLEVYDRFSIENLEDVLEERELQKIQYNRGEIKLNKKELIQLESEISSLIAVQSYISDYGEIDAKLKIEEDYYSVIQLEKYAFNEIHNYVDQHIDISDLEAQLENKEKELEALLKVEKVNEDQIELLEKDIESIKAEIIEREVKGTNISGYSTLIKREEALDSIISKNNIRVDSYTSICDFLTKSGRISRSYIALFMGIGVIVLLLLTIAQKWIVKKVSDKRLRRFIIWKNNHFERNDSFIFIVVLYAILILCCIITFYPLLNVLSIALRPSNNLFSTTLEIIPKDWTFNNFKQAIVGTNLLIWLKNSFIVSLAVSVIGVVFSASAGYSFSRFRFYGRRPGMIVLLITQMFPAPMLLLPTYVILSRMGLKDQLVGLLIPYAALAVPFCVWLLKGYFDTIPKSLEESAYVDGCSPFKAFIRIILPLSKPALAIAALFSFMAAWSEYVIARVIVSQADKSTLPVGLVYLQGEFLTLWGVYSAAALMTSIPVLVLFIILSRFLVGGLVLGSVKE